MTATRTFRPLVAGGLAAALPTTDAPGAALPARAALPLDVEIRGAKPAQANVSVPLRLNGPGDVTGVDPDQIVRMDPPPGATDVEPNYLALVELRRPELPWLFTPAKADAQGRLRPWLVLVVVEAGAGTLATQPGAARPVLDAPRSELPDLAESWAWAHGQEGADAAAVARLVCPRRLRPKVAYLACLVPAFAAGRRAGLGESADDAALQPAWTTEARVRLPVYHHWRFTTGLGGDFESLAERLAPRALPAGVGTLPIDAAAPGWGIKAAARARLPLTGALRPAGSPDEREEDVAPELRAALRAALAGTGVSPPLYGEWYSRAPGVPADGTPGGWLRDLNLDPRARVAAGLGAAVVRYEQERLMAAAWDQLAAHEREHAGMERAQLAEEVSAALQAREGEPSASGATEVPRFAPSFPQPMYEALRDWFGDKLLAGLGDVPPNTIALLETNPRFIEAFLAGLNHELSRELMWRGFPMDRRGTYFTRFWDGAGAIPPMREWPAGSRLGTHSQGDAAQLVLLVRGDLLARFPRARVYAVEATWDAERRALGTRRLDPSFRGRMDPDVTFLGFPLTGPVARGAADPPGHAGWFFVLEEPAGDARFGFDETDAGAREPGAIASWTDLTWADVGTAAGAHVALGGRLAGVERPERTGSAQGVTAAWGRNAAHMAVIAQQRPFRAAVHARAWLPDGKSTP